MKLPGTSTPEPLSRIALALYVPLLLRAVLFKTPAAWQSMHISLEEIRYRLSYGVNLVPLKTVRFYLSGYLGWRHSLFNLGGNLVLLMPLGFLLPYAFPRLATLRQVAVVGFLVSLALETIQLIIGLGSFDVDDLILNLLGAVMGWVAYRVLNRRPIHQ